VLSVHYKLTTKLKDHFLCRTKPKGTQKTVFI